MGLFGKKDTAKKVSDTKNTPKDAGTTAVVTDRNLASVLVKPCITEKAVLALDKNVYTFFIRRDANKYDVRDAIKALYQVTPVKVRTVTQVPRQYMSRMRGRKMLEHGSKKAYVYLKKGDRIDLA